MGYFCAYIFSLYSCIAFIPRRKILVKTPTGGNVDLRWGCSRYDCRHYRLHAGQSFFFLLRLFDRHAFARQASRS